MKTLYLGIEVPEQYRDRVIHYPIIKIIPNISQEVLSTLQDLSAFTHIIFTSKSTVKLFAEQTKGKAITASTLAVGKATAECMKRHNIHVNHISIDETSEGVVETLKQLATSSSYIFWPHSKLSRNIISDYLKKENIRYCECILYDTVSHKPYELPNLQDIKEIVFTSPSTVDAWMELFGPIPKDKTLTPIGPITKAYLNTCLI